MSTHRLFVALRPPRPIRARLIAAMHGISGARWQDDDQLHLTLRFIGEVDRHRAEDIAAALGALHAPAIAARIAGVSLFERHGRPHMVWAGVEPAEPVAALHRKVDQLLMRVGIEKETRAFLPHVTLARFRGPEGQGVLPDLLKQGLGAGLPSLAVRSFALFRSDLHPAGVRYEVLARYPLDCLGGGLG